MPPETLSRIQYLDRQLIEIEQRARDIRHTTEAEFSALRERHRVLREQRRALCAQ